MASGPITSWQIDGRKVETVRFYFLGLQNHWTVTATMKLRHLAPWKKSYDKLRQCVKKQRHHFADKGPVRIVKAMVFPVVMYGCKSWTVKKAEG